MKTMMIVLLGLPFAVPVAEQVPEDIENARQRWVIGVAQDRMGAVPDSPYGLVAGTDDSGTHTAILAVSRLDTDIGECVPVLIVHGLPVHTMRFAESVRIRVDALPALSLAVANELSEDNPVLLLTREARGQLRDGVSVLLEVPTPGTRLYFTFPLAGSAAALDATACH